MILVVDNYDSFTFNLVQVLGALGAKLEVHRNDAIDVAGIVAKRPEGVLLSPGPGRPADSGVCLDVLRDLGGKLPILGVCLGHQALCEVHGGRVVRAPEPVHGKPSDVQHDGRELFEGLPQPLVAGRYHSLVVDPSSVPPCLEVTARTAEGAVMAVRHRGQPSWGVQFHPESILTPDGDRLLANFLNLARRPR